MKGIQYFLAELKRRNLLRVAAFYGGASWLLAQIATQILPVFGVSQGPLRVIVILLIAVFPFVMLFAWFYELTPHGIKLEKDVERSESITRTTGKKLDRMIILVLSLAVLALLLNQFIFPRLMDDDADLAALGRSIAVMPLANSTGDLNNEYFSDGVSEEIIAQLSMLSALKVIGRNSSFQFKGSREDSRSIGEKLGVTYLLEGSVRRAENRVRINVALVKSADGSNVWSETYDRQFNDIFGIQSEIAAAVARQLKLTLLSPAQAAAPAHDLEAYNALLQGNYYAARNTLEDQRKAIQFYEEALRHDDEYALAWARLSVAQIHLVRLFASANSPEGVQALLGARRSAAVALRLDPKLSEAHRAQGLILVNFDFDLQGAQAEYQKAVALAPQDPRPLLELGNLAGSLGRLEEAADYMRRVTAVDPLSFSPLFNIGLVYQSLGKYDEAEAALKRARQLQPQGAQLHTQLASVEILRGNAAKAVTVAQQESDPFWRMYGLALAYAASGDRVQADAMLQKLIAEDADDAGSQIASVYALRKEPDKMFEWLEHARATKDPGVTEILNNPFMRGYKADPRFDAFARKVGLIPGKTG